MEKLYSVLIHLGVNSGRIPCPELIWDDECWQKVISDAPKYGINTVVIDVNDGVEFSSHPEIAVKGAWSKSKMREEIKRCNDLGLTVIPKFNFATTHARWLGVYHRMTSTPAYYHVCNDLIKEVYELFNHPKYIHIGMDEEDLNTAQNNEFCIIRQGELFWHDLRFLIDCVKSTGAMPWMWSCPLFDDPKGFREHIDPKEVLISPWYYYSLNKAHWNKIGPEMECKAFYKESEIPLMNGYVENHPFLAKFRENALPLLKEGYMYVPCASNYYNCKYNTQDIFEYFKENAPDDQIVGYMTAPWIRPRQATMSAFEESFRMFKEAKELYYN